MRRAARDALWSASSARVPFSKPFPVHSFFPSPRWRVEDALVGFRLMEPRSRTRALPYGSMTRMNPTNRCWNGSTDSPLTIASAIDHTGRLRRAPKGAETDPWKGRRAMPIKSIYTTGEAAKICKVSQQTIIRCFDSGQLKGFRVPGSKFRRIPRAALYRFMKENGIPTDALDSGKRKLLVVDDDKAVVDLIAEVLANDSRFEVRVVNNGFEAGAQAVEYHPDLIILDVMLPDINGKSVCELIRRDPTLSDIKILCISGMVEADKIEELKAAGADDFLQKPLDVDVLMKRVCELLELSTTSAEEG